MALYKAIFYVRDDMQIERVYYFDIYTSVVECLVNKWATKQVHYLKQYTSRTCRRYIYI